MMQLITTDTSDFEALRNFLGHREFFKGLPICLVGLSFDSKTRHLADTAATVLD